MACNYILHYPEPFHFLNQIINLLNLKEKIYKREFLVSTA